MYSIANDSPRRHQRKEPPSLAALIALGERGRGGYFIPAARALRTPASRRATCKRPTRARPDRRRSRRQIRCPCRRRSARAHRAARPALSGRRRFCWEAALQSPVSDPLTDVSGCFTVLCMEWHRINEGHAQRHLLAGSDLSVLAFGGPSVSGYGARGRARMSGRARRFEVQRAGRLVAAYGRLVDAKAHAERLAAR